jgi:hypothetical protein
VAGRERERGECQTLLGLCLARNRRYRSARRSRAACACECAAPTWRRTKWKKDAEQRRRGETGVDLRKVADLHQIRRCLDELDRELFRIADDPECERFHQNTQLTAVLLLLLRSSSLLRSLTSLIEVPTSEDAFHLVLRGFEESWNIAHDLRLRGHHDRAENWLAQRKDSWSARISALVAFAMGRGHPGPQLGRDYGSLSELAHPTRSAAENSTTLCGVRLGIPGAAETVVVEEHENCLKRLEYGLYRLLWLAADQDVKFIVIPMEMDRSPESTAFLDAYEDVEPGP